MQDLVNATPTPHRRSADESERDGGWSNLWGTIAADRWSWFIRKVSELNSKSPLV